MSANRELIQEQIKAQGDLVRQLKASKESKEKVSFGVDTNYFCSTTCTLSLFRGDVKLVDLQ